MKTASILEDNIIKKPSLLSNFSISDREEEKVIEEALTTPYEKVMKILHNLKNFLELNKSNEYVINDLVWVIERIRSHTLYTYEVVDNATELQKYSQKSHEIKSFIDYLNNYSETKDIQRRNKAAKFSTVKETNKINFRKSARQSENFSPVQISARNGGKDGVLNTIDHLKTIELESKEDKAITNNIEQDKQNKEIEFKRSEIKFASTEFNPFNTDTIKLKPTFDTDIILSKDFDIFAFDKTVGREYTLIVGAKALFEHFDIDLFISAKHLTPFLTKVKNKYFENTPYHNDLHGLDVCLTVGSYLNYSNIVSTLYLADLDITAMIIASLVHDLAHPGYNNGFQINSLSEIAITYNDISVLESYHICEAFKILLDPECAILQNLNKDSFKIIRRRIIEAILATDMTHHAKINSSVKNILNAKGISKGINSQALINTDSKTFFDDQQEVVNFLVHTADLSHNSKNFELSYKWTYMLTDEFLKQGDLEKEKNLNISFLCDRKTSDVPKSQIGFIRGIIIPTFDILIDIWPSLSFYKENVDKNLDEWGKIVAKNSSA